MEINFVKTKEQEENMKGLFNYENWWKINCNRRYKSRSFQEIRWANERTWFKI